MTSKITRSAGYHLLFLLFSSLFMPLICLFDPLSMHNSFAALILSYGLQGETATSVIFLLGCLFMILFIISLFKIYYDKHKWMVIPLTLSACDIIVHIVYTFTVNIGIFLAYGILSPIGLIYKIWRTYVFYKYYIYFRNTTTDES